MFMHVDDDTGKTIGQYGQTTIQEHKATFHTTCVAQKMRRSIKGLSHTSCVECCFAFLNRGLTVLFNAESMVLPVSSSTSRLTPFGHVSAGIALVLACTRAVNHKYFTTP